MPHPTLTARWSNVVLATFVAPPGALSRYMPAGVGAGGLEVDLYAAAPLLLGDGRPAAAVSLVGRSASNVRLLGIKWPRLTRFESLSLRICVRERESGRRGVVYVREVVSSRAVAWLLRRWYNHPCVTADIHEEVKQQTMLIGAEYRLQWPTGGLAPGSYVSKMMETTEQMVRVVGTKPATRGAAADNAPPAMQKVHLGRQPSRTAERPRRGTTGAGVKSEISTLKSPGSDPSGHTASDHPRETLESWLTERPFVFGLDHRAQGLVHEVIHPSWGAYPAVDSSVRVDFASMFGPDLGFLTGMTPAHVMLAVGSEVAMFPARGGKAGVRWGTKRG